MHAQSFALTRNLYHLQIHSVKWLRCARTYDRLEKAEDNLELQAKNFRCSTGIAPCSGELTKFERSRISSD
jgi:hypothetical protein